MDEAENKEGSEQPAVTIEDLSRVASSFNNRHVATGVIGSFTVLPNADRIEMIQNLERWTRYLRKAHRSEKGTFDQLNKPR